MTHKIAKRSGWSIAEGEPEPGDVIEFPGALTTNPRGPEKYAWKEVDEYVDEQPDLVVREVREKPPNTPACCGFCSPESAIAERGAYQPDYVLVTQDGTEVVYTCHACIADAPIVDRND